METDYTQKSLLDELKDIDKKTYLKYLCYLIIFYGITIPIGFYIQNDPVLQTISINHKFTYVVMWGMFAFGIIAFIEYALLPHFIKTITFIGQLILTILILEVFRYVLILFGSMG